MEVIMTPSPDTSQPEQAVDDAPSGTLAIETHGLSKHFGQRKAVDGLTISIPAGPSLALSAPMVPGRRPPFACCWDWCDQVKAAPRFLANRWQIPEATFRALGRSSKLLPSIPA